MTSREADTLMEEAHAALKFGDGVPNTSMKETAYMRAIAHSITVLAQCALDSRREGKS